MPAAGSDEETAALAKRRRNNPGEFATEAIQSLYEKLLDQRVEKKDEDDDDAEEAEDNPLGPPRMEYLCKMRGT